MADYYSRDGEEAPFDVERESSTWAFPSAFASTRQLLVGSAGFMTPPPREDGQDFSIPPPQADGHGFPKSLPPATSSPVPGSVYWPLYQEVDRNTFSTPPRTKRSEKLPGTPDTISSRQDEEERGVIDFPNFYMGQEHEQTSNSTLLSRGQSSDSSPPTYHKNLAEGLNKQWWFFQTKYAIVITILLLLLITILLATYFLLPDENIDDIVGSSLSPQDSAPFGTMRPVASPSRRPTPNPTSISTVPPTGTSPSAPFETMPPVASPSRRPTPTSPPTRTTPSPIASFEGQIREFLFQNSDVNVEVEQKALAWLVDEAKEAESLVFPLDQKYLQRFGILILFFSIDPNVVVEPTTNPDKIVRLPNFYMRNHDECLWIGITCDENGLVTEIKLPGLLFDGTLPAEWGFFPNLKSIDFSKNELEGSIPEGMYDILGLEEVHLYKNRLTGTISSKIGNLWSLRRFNLNNNRLSGSIPPELRSSDSRIRPLRSFNVHRNQMTGTIPTNMRLRQLYYIDLGRNEFSGTLPPDFGTESVRLRHLYLDHNKFEGSFPYEVLNAGDGRLKALALNDNQFTGAFPGELSHTMMVEMTIQNNNFVAMSPYTCLLDIHMGGWLLEFKSDCSICGCGSTFLCQNCEP